MLPELGLWLDAEPGAIRQLEPTIDAVHPGIDKAQIGVEHRILMLVKWNVKQACGSKQASRMKNGDPYSRMRNDTDPLRCGELGDSYELRKPRMRDLRLDNADTAMRQTRPHLENCAPFFAAGDGHGDVGGNVGLAVDILWWARRFGEVRPVGLQRAD